MTNGLFSNFSANIIQEHLTAHRYFLGLNLKRQPTWCETFLSYREEIFIPIYKAIYSWDFDVSSPKVKKEDLYFRLSTHLYYLRQQHPETTVEQAAKHFCCVYGCDKQGKMLVNLLSKISY
jgi:hypothetical protein